MAERAGKILPPLIGLKDSSQMISSVEDGDFINKLSTEKFDVVMFAPGACRWSAAAQPIPGGNEVTKGWSLDEYRKMVKEYQGDVIIVETTEEKNIVPLLKAALK